MRQTIHIGSPALRAAGALAVLFYGAHAGVLLADGLTSDLLWCCHLAALLVGFGLLTSSPRLNAAGFLWLCLGLPSWIAALASGMEFYPSSVLTHVGALLLGGFGIVALGFPRGTWLRAAAALAVLWAFTRTVTPAAPNVNLSHGYWFGWEGRYVSYPLYLLILLAAATLLFFAVERLAGRLLRPWDAATATGPQ